jgi:hypothetical protein
MRLSNLVFSLFASAPTHLHSQSKTPIDCVHRPSVSTLEDLVNCYYDYTVSKHTYDHNSYAAAQPSSLARLAWTDVIASVLAVDTPVHCMYVDVPFSLRDSYQVRLFIERVQDGKPYCVLAEVSQNSGKYVRGWGLMVVPASRALVSRFIHISAPHPVADINTAQQAMALFKHTGAKSLFVAGRHKEAYSADSCVGPQYRTTDPSHDTVRLLHSLFYWVRR